MSDDRNMQAHWFGIASLAVSLVGAILTLVCLLDPNERHTLPLLAGAFALFLLAGFGGGYLMILAKLWPTEAVRQLIWTVSHLREKASQETHFLGSILQKLHSKWPQPAFPYQTKLRDHWCNSLTLVAQNRDYAWLLPPPSPHNLGRQDLKDTFFQLQLEEWAQMVSASDDGPLGLLDMTKYLFITWDLHKVTDYTSDQLRSLARMLIPLSSYSKRDLLIDRFLVLSIKELEHIDIQRKLFLEIWLPFFERAHLENYRFGFLDWAQIRSVVGEEARTAFVDSALFSRDEQMKSRAASRVLPETEVGLQKYDGYQYCQFSKTQHDFSFLYWAEGEGGPSREKIGEIESACGSVIDNINNNLLQRYDATVSAAAKEFFSKDTDYISEYLARIHREQREDYTLLLNLIDAEGIPQILSRLQSTGLVFNEVPRTRR